jgi:hypothetical protein
MGWDYKFNRDNIGASITVHITSDKNAFVVWTDSEQE